METEIVGRLLEINRSFYDQFAIPFAETRASPQPGFAWLKDQLPDPCPALLDVGCGEGRLGRYLLELSIIQTYVGVDFSEQMLAIARSITPGEFHQRDLSQANPLTGMDQFDAITSLATFQHIPGRKNRVQLLGDMGEHLKPNGRIILSNWQFLDSPRQRKKVVDWKTAGLSSGDVEGNDFLLTWQRGGSGLRYVSFIGPKETAEMANKAGLRIIESHKSDGREGNLNLYTVLAKSQQK